MNRAVDPQAPPTGDGSAPNTGDEMTRTPGHDVELDAAPTSDLAEFDTVLAQRRSVALSDLEPFGGMSRIDRKFLLPLHRVATFVQRLGDQFAALDVDGRRAFSYTSAYFDTPDLLTYHLHRQGRRRRCKVRTRHYGDPSEVTLEVKCQTARGDTVKFRRSHRGHSPYLLDDAGAAFAAASLRHHFGLSITEHGWGAALLNDIGWRVETRFLRSTLTDLATGERVTVDRGLTVADRQQQIAFNGTWAIVEIKTIRAAARAIPVLRQAGAREDRLSKYCLGVAALQPATPAAPWRRSLRTLTAASGQQDRRNEAEFGEQPAT